MLLEMEMLTNLKTYAEVFDWLITKGVSINIYPDKYSYDGNDM